MINKNDVIMCSDVTTAIECDTEASCVVCGKPTKFVDYCSEVRLCSKKCQDEFYTRIASV